MMNRLNNPGLKVYFCTELVDGGLNEDGRTQEALRAYVEVETPEGYRFRHVKNFMTSTWEPQEDWYPTWVNRIEEDKAHAQHLVERIEAHLRMGGTLNPDQWNAVQGAYGSQGWDELAELEAELAANEW